MLNVRFLAFIFIMGLCLDLNAATIKESKRKVSRLKKSVRKFELSLKSTNAQFSKVIDMKNQLFEDIAKTEQGIDLIDESLKIELEKFKSTLLRYEALDYSVEESDLKLVAVRRLKRKKDKIIKDKIKLKELRKSLVSLQDKLSDYEFLEVDLIKKIESIGNKVTSERIKLVSEKNKYNGLRKQQALKAKKKQIPIKKIVKVKKETAESMKKISLSLPVNSPLRTEKDNDGGVNFYLAQKQTIHSPGDGTIIYSGRLSKYGNVIVVGHEDGYRSILLGKFLSNVSKGQKVSSGEKLAQALEVSEKDNKLYFEFRKNKKKLIAENFLSQRI